MKFKIITYIFILFSIVSCKDKDPILRDFPVIKTLSTSNIDSTGAVLNGLVIKKGNSSNCVYGFMIDTMPPVYGKSKQLFINSSPNSNTYSLKVDSNLINGFKYYVTFFSILDNNKKVYANTTSFISKGSSKSFWKQYNTMDWSFFKNVRLETKIACIGTKNYGLIVTYKNYNTFSDYIFNPKTKTFSKNGSDIGTFWYFDGDIPYRFTPTIINDSVNVVVFNQSINLSYENKKWINKTDFLFLDQNDEYSICQISNDIYCFSEYKTLIYNLTTKKITTKQNSSNSPGTTLCVINNEIYGIYYDNLRKYSKEQNKWIALSKTPGINQSALCTFNNKIFLIIDPKPYTNDITEKQLWYFDINTQNWSLIKFPVPIYYTDFNFLFDDKFYFGDFSSDKYVVWELDLSKI